MKRKIKVILKSKVSSMIFLGLSFMALGGCDHILNPDPPTDIELEKIFRDNRVDFERIVKMSDEDSSMSVISYKFTVVEGKGSSTDTGNLGLSEDRWQEYKSLFDRIGLANAGILRGKDGSVHFRAFTKGLATGGMIKGYIYSLDDTPKGDFK